MVLSMKSKLLGNKNMDKYNYPKEFIKGDGRRLVSGGPRDLQRRHKITQLMLPTDAGIEDLKKQIKNLQLEIRETLNGRTPSGYFTAEEVDEEIRKAVAQAAGEVAKVRSLKAQIKKLKNELKEVEELKKEIALLKQALTGKEELVEALKSKPAIIGDKIVTDPDRPQMEKKFIDPLETDAGKGLKSFIKSDKIIKKSGDEEIDEQVDKLRGLLNKPKK